MILRYVEKQHTTVVFAGLSHWLDHCGSCIYVCSVVKRSIISSKVVVLGFDKIIVFGLLLIIVFGERFSFRSSMIWSGNLRQSYIPFNANKFVLKIGKKNPNMMNIEVELFDKQSRKWFIEGGIKITTTFINSYSQSQWRRVRHMDPSTASHIISSLVVHIFALHKLFLDRMWFWWLWASMRTNIIIYPHIYTYVVSSGFWLNAPKGSKIFLSAQKKIDYLWPWLYGLPRQCHFT